MPSDAQSRQRERRFTIRWLARCGYVVSIPRLDSAEVVMAEDYDRLREAIRNVGSAWRGGDDAEIATAIGAATDAACLREQEGS